MLDSADLGAFCERTLDDVYRYALRLTEGDSSQSADLTQESYTALLRHVERHPDDPVRLPWLITCCRHRHLDAIRDHRRRERDQTRGWLPPVVEIDERQDDALFDGWLNSVEATASDELRATIRQMAAIDHQSAVPVDPGRPRLWRLGVAVTATIAVGVVGLVALLDRGDSPSTLNSAPTQPRPDVTTPATTVEAAPTPLVTTPTVSALEDPPSTVMDPPSNPALADLGFDEDAVLSTDDALAALVTLDDYRVGLLRESQGFRATATLGSTWVLTDGSKPQPDDPPTIVDVTVLESGDVWADYMNGDWFRFDGATGIGRSLRTNPTDGSQFPLEMNRSPYQHNYGSVLGHDPLQMLGGFAEMFPRPETVTVEISDVAFEGGLAVEVRFDIERLGAERFVVDLGSGLIVEHESTQPQENGTLGLYSSISGVTAADVLPVTTMPQLPDGLEWQRLDGPTDVFPVTLEEARSAFGSGLILPQAAVDAGTSAMEYSASTSDGLVVGPNDPNGEIRFVGIDYVETVGLLRTTFHSHTERLGPDGTVPAGYVEAGDRVCREPWGCSWEPLGFDAIMPEAGALAGVWFHTDYRGLGTIVDGVGLSIQAPTRDEAIALANTFVTVAVTE